MVLNCAFKNDNKALPLLARVHIIRQTHDKYIHTMCMLLNGVIYMEHHVFDGLYASGRVN